MRYKVPLIASVLWKIGRVSRNIPLLKRTWPSILKRVIPLLWGSNEKIITIEVGVFSLNITRYVERLIAFYGDYEHKQVDYLLSVMKKSKADVFFDIGANIGYYTIAAAARAEPSKIISFEPDQRSIKQIKLNLQLSGISDKVEVVGSAVSDKTGKVEFNLTPDASPASSWVGSGENSITVDCAALDDFYDFKDKCLFMKIDIEGHELSALKGMDRLLKNNKVFMQLECFDENLPSTLPVMEELGFAMVNEMGWDRYFTNFDLPE